MRWWWRIYLSTSYVYCHFVSYRREKQKSLVLLFYWRQRQRRRRRRRRRRQEFAALTRAKAEQAPFLFSSSFLTIQIPFCCLCSLVLRRRSLRQHCRSWFARSCSLVHIMFRMSNSINKYSLYENGSIHSMCIYVRIGREKQRERLDRRVRIYMCVCVYARLV